MSDLKQRWVAVARILRPRGNKGEVAVELLTDFPERLARVPRIYLADSTAPGEPQAHEVVSFWIDQNHKGRAVFRFAGIESISQAEQLRGGELLLPIEERIQLPAGMYFVTDLIGCAVFDRGFAEPAVASSPCSMATAPVFLGKVTHVEFVGESQAGTPLLRVDSPQGELLIPLAQEICFHIDVAARRIDVQLPEGLRELNGPE